MPKRILFSCQDAAETYLRAQSLADDLRRLAAGDLPTAEDLACAPVITDWSVTLRPESCLVGVISGHPTIGLMRPGRTSGIFAMDAVNCAWVRTWSRYYKLGRQAGQEGTVQ
jgi:hypothetical protein